MAIAGAARHALDDPCVEARNESGRVSVLATTACSWGLDGLASCSAEIVRGVPMAGDRLAGDPLLAQAIHLAADLLFTDRLAAVDVPGVGDNANSPAEDREDRPEEPGV
jgi:hypothetical protein